VPTAHARQALAFASLYVPAKQPAQLWLLPLIKPAMQAQAELAFA
jgi:hypothetical protein